MPYKINDSCTKCGLCVKECPCKAIDNLPGKYHIHEDLCCECMACIDVCKSNSIEYICYEDNN